MLSRKIVMWPQHCSAPHQPRCEDSRVRGLLELPASSGEKERAVTARVAPSVSSWLLSFLLPPFLYFLLLETVLPPWG